MSYVNIQGRRQPFVIRYVADLLAYRHLCANLVASDLRTRFRRSALGIFWAAAQPLGMALIIAVVWASVFGATDYWEFAIYVFAGLIVWEYFTTNVLVGQEGLINSGAYLKQTRIPFFIFQLRTPLIGIVIMFFGTIALFGLILALQRLPAPGLHLLLVPVFFGIYLLFAIPVSIIMSLMGAYFRDLRYISSLAVQGLFFLSPVFLRRDVLAQEHLEFFKYVNPLVPLLDMFRAPIVYGRMWERAELLTLGVWIAGLWVVAVISAMRVGRRVIFTL